MENSEMKAYHVSFAVNEIDATNRILATIFESREAITPYVIRDEMIPYCRKEWDLAESAEIVIISWQQFDKS